MVLKSVMDNVDLLHAKVEVMDVNKDGGALCVRHDCFNASPRNQGMMSTLCMCRE